MIPTALARSPQLATDRTVPSARGAAGAESADTDAQWKIVYALWFVRLLRPEWLLSYYAPPLVFLRILPTLLLGALFCYWVISQEKRVAEFKWILFYFVFVLLTAPLAESFGRTKPGIRFFFELSILGMATTTFTRSTERADALMRLFVFQFLYLAVWGVIGRGIVRWDNFLNEEDAFGPVMGVGVAYCSQCLSAARTKSDRWIALSGFVACVVGVIASFARGAFISLCIILMVKILVSKNKVANIAGTIAAGVVIYIASFALFSVPAPGQIPTGPGTMERDQGHTFWQEMATSTEGTSAGTGHDRQVLWAVAWEAFKANPIIGVGIYNFGIAAPHYIGAVKDRGDRYVDPMQIWGRALHNGYFQILSEGGMVGVLLFLGVLIDFYRSNKRIQAASAFVSPEDSHYEHLAAALRMGIFAFMLNMFFYDITYYTWFWDFMLINKVLSIRIVAIEKQGGLPATPDDAASSGSNAAAIGGSAPRHAQRYPERRLPPPRPRGVRHA